MPPRAVHGWKTRKTRGEANESHAQSQPSCGKPQIRLQRLRFHWSFSPTRPPGAQLACTISSTSYHLTSSAGQLTQFPRTVFLCRAWPVTNMCPALLHPNPNPNPIRTPDADITHRSAAIYSLAWHVRHLTGFCTATTAAAAAAQQPSAQWFEASETGLGVEHVELGRLWLRDVYFDERIITENNDKKA